MLKFLPFKEVSYMALLLIAVVDEKTRIPAFKVTETLVIELTKKCDTFTDKIRYMQNLNEHETLKAFGLRVTWRLDYGVEHES